MAHRATVLAVSLHVGSQGQTVDRFRWCMLTVLQSGMGAARTQTYETTKSRAAEVCSPATVRRLVTQSGHEVLFGAAPEQQGVKMLI